jgi:hypothetical protein
MADIGDCIVGVCALLYAIVTCQWVKPLLYCVTCKWRKDCSRDCWSVLLTFWSAVTTIAALGIAGSGLQACWLEIDNNRYVGSQMAMNATERHFIGSAVVGVNYCTSIIGKRNSQVCTNNASYVPLQLTLLGVEDEASVRTVTFQLCAAGIAFGALCGIISVLLLPLPCYKLIRSISHWLGAICVVSGAVCGSLLIGAHFWYTNRITLPVTAALNQNGVLTGYSASAVFSGSLSLSGGVIMFVCCLLVLISRLCVCDLPGMHQYRRDYDNTDDSRHTYRSVPGYGAR